MVGREIGSFGFAKGRLVCRAKPNVPFVRLAKIVFKKCAVGNDWWEMNGSQRNV